MQKVTLVFLVVIACSLHSFLNAERAWPLGAASLPVSRSSTTSLSVKKTESKKKFSKAGKNRIKNLTFVFVTEVSDFKEVEKAAEELGVG